MFRGYTNVDSSPESGADLIADITKDLPYEDGSVDEIIAIHVLEHLFPWKVQDVLAYWFRLLKPGGKLILEMPDLKKILEHFKAPEVNMTLTMNALYGVATGEKIEECHKWAWTYHSLAPVFEAVGFKTEEKPPLYHIPVRDFRIEGVKP